jgi:leader peptidase (prepilin peptidase)/N-methyltransferase
MNDWIITHTTMIAALFVFLFGAAIGSFLNVVILRLPKHESLVRPPSHCPKCNYKLRWYDNIPILSYLMLGAKCRSCKAPISIQYPLIELISAALAVACYAKFGLGVELVVYFLFCALLIAISFIDIPYQIIPNELSLPGIALGIAASFVTRVQWFDAVIGAAVGFVMIALIVYGYWFLTKREGMGMGDAKLLAMLAAFLGWQSIPFILLAASIQGLVIALAGIGLGFIKKAPPLPDPDEEPVQPAPDAATQEETPLRFAAVPFGPFLSLAAIEFLFFGDWYYTFLLSLSSAG